jgi:steroid 5-alpha reductase family enzyme
VAWSVGIGDRLEGNHYGPGGAPAANGRGAANEEVAVAAWQVWLWGLVVVQALMVAVWAVSVARTDASLVDRFWGVAFVVLGWTYALVGDGADGRVTVMLVLVTVWGLRLAGYITWRNWGKGEDPRYAAMRAKAPGRFPVRSLVTVFGLQGVLAWLISLPLLAAATAGSPTGLVWLDYVAIVVWVVGFVFEAGGDWQLSRFLADPANRGKVMDRGLWRYTRHPNYFGDTTVWWAYFLLALATGAWWAAIGSVLMTLFIVKVSGVALTEKRMESGFGGSKREGYEEYVARTNAFFPGPPRRR